VQGRSGQGYLLGTRFGFESGFRAACSVPQVRIPSSEFRVPFFRFSVFPFSAFPLFRFSAFPLFRFSAFPLFRFSAFPLFRFSDREFSPPDLPFDGDFCRTPPDPVDSASIRQKLRRIGRETDVEGRMTQLQIKN
jgi:hypothetical protein